MQMEIIDNDKRGTERRRILAFGVSVAVNLLLLPDLAAANRRPLVLFICQFGTAKSAIARELLRRRAAQRNMAVAAFSRGITPEPHLADSTRARLAAEGIDLDGDAVKRLRKTDIRAADIVVTFNVLPPSLVDAKVRDWSSLPSVNDSYDLARSDLDRRIDHLLDGL